MTSQEKAFQDFADFAARLKGDEKSEAQTFLFHLLEAFNHDANTLPEGCTFEYRVRFPGDRTKYADLVWPGRVLIEMKSRGEKLSRHYQQTFDYWLNLVPHRPPYVVLCDFDEFWIYDFNTQFRSRWKKSRSANCANAIPRSISSTRASRCRFSATTGSTSPAMPPRTWQMSSTPSSRAANPARTPAGSSCKASSPCSPRTSGCCRTICSPNSSTNPASRKIPAASYDLIGGLFRQMNDPKPARGGRFAGVDYFNGGLFSKVEPVELQPGDIGLLFEAAKQKWQYVQPVIFGTLFEGSLGKEERHALGAHFTYEADIQKIVRPTIVRPWEERIAAAKNVSELLELLRQLRAFRVLDPACGSGNFLFVAYRALRELEQNLLVKLFAQDKKAVCQGRHGQRHFAQTILRAGRE